MSIEDSPAEPPPGPAGDATASATSAAVANTPAASADRVPRKDEMAPPSRAHVSIADGVPRAATTDAPGEVASNATARVEAARIAPASEAPARDGRDSPGASETPARGRDAATELLAIGSEVAGRFVIESVIGVGGMGVVYLARDPTLERRVAIKLHQADWGGERLQREAVAMARLAHPNVITVFEVGRVGKRTFVAMEFVAGKTLRAWASAKPRTVRDKLRILADAGAGLAAAHAAGLVHRDFKPDNILIGDDGRARVGDFGLARGSDVDTSQAGASGASGASGTRVPRASTAPSPRRTPTPLPVATAKVDAEGETLDASSASPPLEPTWRAATSSSSGQLSTPLTQTGTVLGTPAYMAPEQARSGAIDARADQFAFCVVAWELLFGARPFAGTNLAELIANIERGARLAPPRSAHIAAPVRQVLERGMAATPSERYPDMTALLVALRRAEHARARSIGGAVGVGVVAGGIAGALLLHHGTPAARDCERGATALAALVPTTLPAQVRALGGAEALEAADRIGAELDMLRGSLASSSRQVCRADDDHAMSPMLAQRANACLQIAARTAARMATVDSGTLTADDVPRLVIQTQELADVAPCIEPSALLAAPALPSDPARLAQMVDARAALGAALAKLGGNDVTTARALIAEVERSAVASDPAIAATLQLVRAKLANASDQQADAERGFEDAYYAARAIDDVDVSLSAASNLIIIADEVDSDPHKAERWIRTGVADAERARARVPRTAAAVFVAAAAASDRTHPDQAAGWCATALQLEGAAPSLGRIEALGVDGEIACVRGEVAHCFAAHDDAIAEARALLGAHHIRIAYLLQNAALDYSDVGRGVEAIARAREAVALLRASHEASTIDSLTSLDTLAALLMSSGRDEDQRSARAILEDIYPKLAAKVGADSPQLVVVESNLSIVYTNAGELERARTLLDHALAIADTNLGHDHPGVADVLYNVADNQDARKDYAGAAASAKRMLAIRAASAPGSVLYAEALSLNARIANDAGDAKAALALAQAAVALPSVRDPIIARARAELELGRAAAALRVEQPAALAAIADARAIFVGLAFTDSVGHCDAVTALLARDPAAP